MIRLDSVKLLVGSDSIQHIDTNRMVLNQTTEPGTGDIFIENYSTNMAPGIGFKRVSYNSKKSEAILELSAKVLKDQYFELINKNTIERVFSEVNKISPVTFDIQKAIDTTRVLSMDCTNNLIMLNEPADYLSALNQIRSNEKYNVTDYKAPGNKGIVIAGKQKTFKERQIFYVKKLDILRDKEFKKEPYFEALIFQHKSVLRAESNFSSLARIRNFARSTNLLKDILTSTANPNLSMFEKITKRNNEFQLYLELENGRYAGMNLNEIEKRIGRENIIKQSNFDINLVIQFVNKARGKGSHNWKIIKEYRNILSEIMPTEGKLATLRNEMIEEIRLKLAG
jgi:hypothetical protein